MSRRAQVQLTRQKEKVTRSPRTRPDPTRPPRMHYHVARAQAFEVIPGRVVAVILRHLAGSTDTNEEST